MVTQRQSDGRAAGGFSLIEMLVASAVFAIAATVAFILYSAAQKSYKSGENFTDQQQSTRVAFDRMVSDIRLAGFNSNPDGDSSRVDEQVEGAWDTAVTIRGDFDFEDPTARVTPESALPGSVYNVVSTGNDEIITYVLAKPGPSGSGTLVFRVDTDKPRTKTVKTVTVPNVAVVQSSPPYTLYRVSLTDVTGAFPSSPQAASAFVYEPVAENIRTMTFLYYDDQGTLLSPNTPANSGDDIGGADSASLTRGRIRRIAINLVGMTSDEDLDYTDVTDASATSHYRKFSLDSDVIVENLGKSGVKDIDITAPPSPTGVSLVAGHCQGILVKWDTPATTSGVHSYSVKYWVNGTPASFATGGFPYPHVEYGVTDFEGHGLVANLAQGTSYCFQVQAKDSAGNASGWAPSSSPPCMTTTEASNPGPATNLAATGSGSTSPLDSKIRVTWTEAQANTNVVANDPDTIGGFTILRDTQGYKLYRDLTPGFTPNDSTNLVATVTALPLGTTSYDDSTVVNCTDYYYKIKTVDRCNMVSAASAETGGRSTTTTPPAKPTGVVGDRTSKLNVSLTWAPVTTNASGNPTYVGLYKIYRAKVLQSVSPSSVPFSSYVLRGTSPSPAYNDTLDNTDHTDLSRKPPYTLLYIVKAADNCGNESAGSDPISIYCNFTGTVAYSPIDGSSNGGAVPISLYASGGTYVRAKVVIARDSDSQQVYSQETFSSPFAFPDWNAAAAGGGDYTIHWEVEDSRGCIWSTDTRFTATASLSCQITPTNPNLSPTSGKPSTQNKKMSWDIVNNSGKDIEIIKVDVRWTNVLGPHILTQLEYPTGAISYPGLCTRPTSTTSAAIIDCPCCGLLTLFATQNGLCGDASCKVNMSLLWDTQIVSSSNVGENVTIEYTFEDATSATGTCTFTVKPDLTIL